MVTLEPFAVETVPLRSDGGSGYLVGGTRVPLDTVIGAYLDGATPEQIVDSFDVLLVTDVYAVIVYFLRHQEQVHAHLEARRRESEQLRREIEQRQPTHPGRERLRTLRKSQSA